MLALIKTMQENKKFKRNLMEKYFSAHIDELLQGKGRYMPIHKVLREINTEPVFYKNGDAFLFIKIKSKTKEKDNSFVSLTREWGIMSDYIGRMRMTERFLFLSEAIDRRDTIIKYKTRQGYKPIF